MIKLLQQYSIQIYASIHFLFINFFVHAPTTHANNHVIVSFFIKTTIENEKKHTLQKTTRITKLHQRSVNIVSRMKNYQLAVFPVNLTIVVISSNGETKGAMCINEPKNI